MLPRCRVGRLAVIVASLVIGSSAALAICDADPTAKPSASRFVIADETVDDRTTRLTWMRCSYGQTWRKGGGCDGDVQPMDWDAAMALRVPGDFRWGISAWQYLRRNQYAVRLVRDDR